MGLSIHYSGQIINEELLESLIEEVTDICESLEWKTHLFDGIGDENHLRGISFAPDESEPIFLTFLPCWRICSPVNLMCRDTYDGIRFDKELMYTSSTKTQYAGPDAHMAIIKLLKYLSGKYLTNFTLSDEGYYWETGDEKIVRARFETHNFLLNVVGDALNGLPVIPGETSDSLLERIERIIKERVAGKNQPGSQTGI